MDARPNPLMMGADIAARTKSIRIGQAANIITFWNPLRAAEDIAMLDHMSATHRRWRRARRHGSAATTYRAMS